MSNCAPTKTVAESSPDASVAEPSVTKNPASNGPDSPNLEMDERCRVGDEIEAASVVKTEGDIKFCRYVDERQMPAIMSLMSKDLSEPYSIYTYRYFICQWPHLTFLAMCDGYYVGAIVCKLDQQHSRSISRGYIAMLTVDKAFRRRRIGSSLVRIALNTMCQQRCDEVVLETEVTNENALRLYDHLGFCRDKRLVRYYMNDVDALRLKLWLT